MLKKKRRGGGGKVIRGKSKEKKLYIRSDEKLKVKKERSIKKRLK